MKIQHEHVGHRQRLRDRYEKGGITALFDYEILEMLLAQIILYADTQPTAKRLLKKFGTVRHVLTASLEELESVDGVGKRTASILNFFGQTFDYIRSDRIDAHSSYSRVEIANACYEAFKGKDYECMVFLCYDRDMELCHSGESTEYRRGYTFSPTIEEIIAEAKAHHAKYIYFAHNHPKGSIVQPSNVDLKFIEKSVRVAMENGIIVLDHTITREPDTYSVYYANTLGNVALKVMAELGGDNPYNDNFVKENFFNDSNWDSGYFNKTEMERLIMNKFDPILN